MNIYYGTGMFLFGVGCTLIGALIAFCIINYVMKEKKEPIRFDDLE